MKIQCCQSGGRIWGAVAFAIVFIAFNVQAKVTVYEVSDKEVAAKYFFDYQENTRWPTSGEKLSTEASAREIQGSLGSFYHWSKLILNSQWFPPTNEGAVFGLKKWGPNESDVLFVEYARDGVLFRISDTYAKYIVTISANDLDDRPSNWEKYFISVCTNYLNGTEGISQLTNFTKLDVRQVLSSGITRVCPILPSDVNLDGLWSSFNPELWVRGKQITFVIAKVTAGGWPMQGDSESGVRQRFPPLSEVIKYAAISNLLEYAANGSPAEEEIAIGELRQRAEPSDVPQIIAAYSHAGGLNSQPDIVLTLGVLSQKYGKPTSTLTLEFIQREWTNHPGFQLKNALMDASNRIVNTSNHGPTTTVVPAP